MAIAREIAEMVGFDLAAGLIARSAHPFTGGGAPRRRPLHHPRSTRRARSSNISAVHARAGARPLRAGLPRLGRPHPGLRRARRSAPTSRSRASGRTRSAAPPAFWERLEPAMRRTLPRGDGAASTRRLLHRAARVVRPVADPRGGRRGHLQPPHRPALRARAGADPRRPGRGRPARRLRRTGWRTCSASARPATRSARCRTSTGRTACSATSRPTPSATCTPPSSPRRPHAELGDLEALIAEGRFDDDPRLHARPHPPPRRRRCRPAS